MSKLATFDMDGTLIQGRLVFALADRFDLSDKVKAIQANGTTGHQQTKAIAMLFAGITKKDLEVAIQSIPVMKNCEQTISKLREKGYKIGIISDSYTITANSIADRLQLDFVAANELEIIDNRVTGRVNMPLGWNKIGCFCKISVCKRYHLEKFASKFRVPMKNTLAVGDTKSDICMIQRAGIGIAFMPKDAEIAKATDKIVQEPDLVKVLEFAA
jgi:phosphoserine phosphatase